MTLIAADDELNRFLFSRTPDPAAANGGAIVDLDAGTVELFEEISALAVFSRGYFPDEEVSILLTTPEYKRATDLLAGRV